MAPEIVRDLKGNLARDGESPLNEDLAITIPIMTCAMLFIANLQFEMPMKLSPGLVEVDEIQLAALAHEIIDASLVRYSEARQSGAL